MVRHAGETGRTGSRATPRRGAGRECRRYVLWSEMSKNVLQTGDPIRAPGPAWGLRTRLVLAGVGVEADAAVVELVDALERHSAQTAEHSRRVCSLAGRIALAMDLPSERVRAVALAALLHDVGKLFVPEDLLAGEGALDERGWARMRLHPELGAALVHEVLPGTEVSHAVLSHHERLDGSGYPSGLRACEIPLEARIIAVADAYDALVNERPYHRPLPPEVALDVLGAAAGLTLDGCVFDALSALILRKGRSGEAGSP